MTIFCLYEDRADHEIGLRLALVSLARRHPSARVVVFAPKASEELRAWTAGRPGVELDSKRAFGHGGWDTKPQCLLALLDRGADEVIWLDTDLIVTADFLPWMNSLTAEEMVVAQDPTHLPHQGMVNRAVAWGLGKGRDLGVTVNSAVLRVTPGHRELLVAWARLLDRPDYRQAQALHFLNRPYHLAGDQDALGALLGSADFAAARVRVLRSGREILHSGGLLMDSLEGRCFRLVRPFFRPLFVHAIATKPWIVLQERAGQAGLEWWLMRLSCEVSTYVAHARIFRREVGEPCPWLERNTVSGRCLRLLGFGNDALRGLPLVVAIRLAAVCGFGGRHRDSPTDRPSKHAGASRTDIDA